MAEEFERITAEQRRLIESAPMFFVASTHPEFEPGPAGQGAVNVSPKGGVPLHVIDDRQVADRATLEARYLERQQSAGRHAGHDVGFTREWLAEAFVAPFPGLEFERTIEVDTSDFGAVDREAILARLLGWLGGETGAESGGAV